MYSVTASVPVIKTIIAHPSDVLCSGLKEKMKRWTIHLLPATYICAYPQLIECLKKYKVEILLLYDALSGSTTCYRELLLQFPSLSIILISDNTDPAYFRQAASSGVKAFVHHTATAKIYRQAIISIMENRLYYSPVIESYFTKQNLADSISLKANLTARQIQVYQHMLAGLPVRKSARLLGTKYNNVKSIRYTIRNKIKAAGLIEEFEKLIKKKK